MAVAVAVTVHRNLSSCLDLDQRLDVKKTKVEMTMVVVVISL